MSKAGQTLDESVNKMLKFRKRLKETFTSEKAKETLAGSKPVEQPKSGEQSVPD